MKKELFFVLCILMCIQAIQAQVRIGENIAPRPGATLDLNSSGYIGGLILPNIAITDLQSIPVSFTDNGSLTPADISGLIVFNTNTDVPNGINPGIYIWDGLKWINAADSNGVSWKVNGNVSSAGRFLGTTNNLPLQFKVNNVNAGGINPTNSSNGYGYLAVNAATGIRNNGFGYKALSVNRGSDNTAMGDSALQRNITGSYNVAVGSNALASNIGSSGSTAVGYGALFKNTSGINTAVGSYALNSNISGDGNTAVGESALSTTAAGLYNTAIGARTMLAIAGGSNSALGYSALTVNTGTQNNAFGVFALTKNTSGSNNCGFGSQVLQNLTTGQNNVAIGNSALSGVLISNNNVAVGYLAGNNASGENNLFLGGKANLIGAGNNNIIIGANLVGVTGTDNQLNIGGWVHGLNGNIGIGTVASINPSYLFYVEGDAGGVSNWTATSDIRLKKDIEESKYGLQTILQMKPIKYKLIGSEVEQIGFSAQEVRKILPYVVVGEEGSLTEGKVLGIQYAAIVPVLAKAIQEQQVIIEDQKSEIEELNKIVIESVQKIDILENKTTFNDDKVKELLKNIEILSKKIEILEKK